MALSFLKRVIAFFIPSLLLMCGAARADNIVSRFPKTLARGADSQGLLMILGGSSLTAGAAQNDEAWLGDIQRENDLSPSTLNYMEWFGTGIPGLLIAGTQYYYNEKDGLSHLDAIVYSSVAVGLLKVSINRERPNGGVHSYPSGHSSAAFATATHLHLRYGWKVGVPAYLIASSTGYERIADDFHWPSDVVMGATLGIFFARAAHRYHFSDSDSKARVFPVISPDYAGLGWMTWF